MWCNYKHFKCFKTFTFRFESISNEEKLVYISLLDVPSTMWPTLLQLKHRFFLRTWSLFTLIPITGSNKYNKTNRVDWWECTSLRLNSYNYKYLFNPIHAGVLENQDMLGGSIWPPPSETHVLCPNMTNDTSLESSCALLLESAKTFANLQKLNFLSQNSI